MIGFLKSKSSWLILFGIICLALFMRLYFQWHQVFTEGGWVRFYENDPWYHMRHILNLTHHFPHLNSFDPYLVYPGGSSVSGGFFDLIVGFFAWVVGCGHPSDYTVEVVAALVPAVMGTLIVIPVFVIGREIFNKTTGLIAAALVAIIPGQFLWRSMLGFVDHHVAELFFSTFTIMFLILAMKVTRAREFSFSTPKKLLGKPLIYSLLAGVSLGCYLLTWSGGAFLLFIIAIFAVIQFTTDHLRGRSTEYLGTVLVITFFTALMARLVLRQYQSEQLQVDALLVCSAAFVGLSLLSYGMTRKGLSGYYYPLLLVTAGGVGLGFIKLVNPSLLSSAWDRLHETFAPPAILRTVAEARGISSLQIWHWFSTDFYISLVTIPILIYIIIRRGAAGKTLLFVWFSVFLAATFIQNRYAYYLAVPLVLLVSYLCWWTIRLSKIRSPYEQPVSARKRRNKGQKAVPDRTVWHKRLQAVSSSLAIVLILFLAFFPNIHHSVSQANTKTAIPDDWHESLTWLRDNSPDPFNDPRFFYDQYDPPLAGKSYAYPDSAYGVLSWWDYGYWISYVARRLPNANPGQAYADVAARFFTAQSEEEAVQVINRTGEPYLPLNSKYVIIDLSMARAQGGFFINMAMWAKKDPNSYGGTYMVESQGQLKPVILYRPEYYQSMVSRLYNFGGEEWHPDDWVRTHLNYKIQAITSVPTTDDKGRQLQRVTDAKQFDNYAKAEAFVNSHAGYVVVGTDPFVSPVPLEELKYFKLVHKSPTVAVQRGATTMSGVEVFQFDNPVAK